jgi:anti-sigma regulatory factor (Ser/Thr protein kinase)
VLSGGGRDDAGTSEISVAISRDPALVRTVRLVAAAVARRSTGDEDFVEEVRLAVGEACALLVGPGFSPNGGPGPVEVRMQLDHRLRVVVRTQGAVPLVDAPSSDIDGIEPWSLLRGLIADLEIDRGPAGTSLSMSWDLPDSSE